MGNGVARRVVQVFMAAWRHLLWPRVRRRRGSDRAERMQAFLEELGGTWVKLGQALALRFDLLPADYCLRFFRLLNQVRPFPAAAVRQVIEEELARPVEELFSSFEWQPMAAASIGQVHRAVLPDGTTVAVKVQRPDIRSIVRADLRLMRWLASVLDTFLLRHTHAREFVREFARWTEEELDYRAEARHAAILRRNAAGDPLEHDAEVIGAYTTSRVLTLEYLPGVAVFDVIEAIRRDDRGFLERLHACGHDPRRIASHIVWNSLNQIYRFGYFHADPHPANLVVLPGDAIGYVDFGIVGKLDADTTDSLRYFAQNLFAGRVARAVDEFMRFLTPAASTDVRSARRDLTDALKSYLESERVGPCDAAPSEDVFEIRMLAIVRDHGMVLAPDIVRYLKAVLTAEAMVRELDPEFDLRAHENRFFGRLMQIELTELSLAHAAQWFVEGRFRLRRVVDAIESMRERSGDLVAVARRVRRVEALALLTASGWIALLPFLVSHGTAASVGAGGFLQAVIVGIGLLGIVLLALSVVELRRLSRAARASGLDADPRRFR
ncbi:MAG TPA: AarF/UbiB family protein [Candidatus Binatia bacterium]|nr:AarF/UbiB family protein [Candidatus Binatia bacterium]